MKKRIVCGVVLKMRSESVLGYRFRKLEADVGIGKAAKMTAVFSGQSNDIHFVCSLFGTFWIWCDIKRLVVTVRFYTCLA